MGAHELQSVFQPFAPHLLYSEGDFWLVLVDDVIGDSQLCAQVCRMFNCSHNTMFPIKTQSAYPSPHTPDRLAQLRPSSHSDLHLALLAGQRGDCKFFRKLAVPAISARILAGERAPLGPDVEAKSMRGKGIIGGPRPRSNTQYTTRLFRAPLTCNRSRSRV